VEVKLDGVRVITIVYPSGNVDQYSRNGKELVNFEHIKRQFAKHARLLREPMVFDGEVMSSSFQDLMRQVHRKSDVEASDAVLHLFDILTLKDFQAGVSSVPQVDRSNSLRVWYNPIADHMPNVTILGHEFVDLDTESGRALFQVINQRAIEGGYEGIMIKDPNAGYETKRSVAWLKQKPYIEVSLTVIGVEEGTGRNAGKLGAIIVEGEDDGKLIRTNVGSGLTDADRDEFWSHRDSLSGRVVEVRADAVTQNQDGSYSLRFPRFKGFRGFEVGEKL
jgi:DNA ligase-1